MFNSQSTDPLYSGAWVFRTSDRLFQSPPVQWKSGDTADRSLHQALGIFNENLPFDIADVQEISLLYMLDGPLPIQQHHMAFLLTALRGQFKNLKRASVFHVNGEAEPDIAFEFAVRFREAR